MLHWRAVGFGVAVGVVLAFLPIIVPVVGHLAVGFAAGFVAGLLAGGGTRNGLIHGAAAGTAAGAVFLVAGVAVILGLGVPSLLDGLGLSRLVLLLIQIGGAVAGVAAAAGGGALGALVRGDRPLPGRARPRSDRQR